MPPRNAPRRRTLADTAIALLAASGVHGVTHRAVEQAAGLPTGTASNYFRTREALLVAATERVVELHLADLDTAAARHRPPSGVTTGEQVDLVAGSLHEAATTHRARYLAVVELRIEALRRPVLAATLARLVLTGHAATAAHHVQLGLDVAPDRIPDLVMLYGGALFTLVTTPEAELTPEAARSAAAAIVRGAGLTTAR